MNDSKIKFIIKAINYAADKHRQQLRKGIHATPYINHPIKVMHELTVHNIENTQVLIAAVLHDILEDTSTTPDELKGIFGVDITNIVVELSDNKLLNAKKRKELQVQNASNLSDEAKVIRIADKICNLTDIVYFPPEWKIDRKIKYYHWAKSVVDQCANVHNELYETFYRVYKQGIDTLMNIKNSSGPSD